jgi:hypothetical protein
MQPSELPGFYFDSEKKRYFPLSHQKRARAVEESTATASSSSQSKTHSKRHNRQSPKSGGLTTEDGIVSLLRLRQIWGNGRSSQCGNSPKAFQGRYLEMQKAQPRVWKYSDTPNWADAGIEQLCSTVQTPQGEVPAEVILLGGSDGKLVVSQIVEKVTEEEYLPPLLKPDLWTGDPKDAPVLLPK